ncbi:MAG: carboxylating nicotinate-nucleotide diphosphorylase [Gammaproteobacteria bacterium]|nr:MAG: carboxylating nicotinate-nucleotide diphosphorylase [Gammaproteobacteria bacterium]
MTIKRATLPGDIEETVRRALAEDIGPGDLTANLIPADRRVTAEVVSRDETVLCGQAWFDEVFRQVDNGIRIVWQVRDGDSIRAGHVLCRIQGFARGVLTGERTALNLLQTLSGTATRTRAYVEAVRGTPAAILDTRKTLPGLRTAQKYAVRCGGGQNHRMGLFGGILIKENHILAAGSIAAAIRSAKARAAANIPVEIEVENLDQLREALAGGANHLLLDNFDPADLKTAVAECGGKIKLEASGNITLDNIRAVAETGVDYISIGDLTKNVTAIDLSLRITD